jgi:hypothetical protein
MMEAIRFSETSVPTRATLHNIPEDGILHSRRRENLRMLQDSLLLAIISAQPPALPCPVLWKPRAVSPWAESLHQETDHSPCSHAVRCKVLMFPATLSESQFAFATIFNSQTYVQDLRFSPSQPRASSQIWGFTCVPSSGWVWGDSRRWTNIQMLMLTWGFSAEETRNFEERWEGGRLGDKIAGLIPDELNDFYRFV